jgi:DNA-binding XRE family transcriptional regulator
MTIEEEKHQRALAWRRFRRDFLYSQKDLAHALRLGLRTVSAIENEESVPTLPTLRAFRNLVRREREAMA